MLAMILSGSTRMSFTFNSETGLQPVKNLPHMNSITQHAIPGGWSDRETRVGHHTFRLFTPTDPDRLLDHLESPEAATQPHLADPYWAKLWPAAPLLAAAIMRQSPPRGTQVLELGCGSGLVGIAALACGLDVTFSDYVPFTVELARENAARNGFADAKGIVLDWRAAEVQQEPFPLIVAADVTYDRANLAPLLEVLDRLLAPDGEAWFGDAGRSPVEDFLQRSRERGWSVSLFDEHDRQATAPMLGKYQRIVLRRNASKTALLSASA
jgi:ETFB lysine methyltransferase